jgi:sarcosine oxidase subunit delta
LNGPRDAGEFVYGGEVATEPDSEAPALEWSRHVFLEDNTKGVVDEWWCHTASSYWFIVKRDRTSDRVIATYTTEAYYAGVQTP